MERPGYAKKVTTILRPFFKKVQFRVQTYSVCVWMWCTVHLEKLYLAEMFCVQYLIITQHRPSVEPSLKVCPHTCNPNFLLALLFSLDINGK